MTKNSTHTLAPSGVPHFILGHSMLGGVGDYPGVYIHPIIHVCTQIRDSSHQS